MPEGTVPLLIALIALVLLSGFFSSTETAYSCLSRIKLRSMASGGNKKAQKVLALAEDNFDKLISTILVGNNIVNLSAATIATVFFERILSSSTLNSSLISTIVITVAVLIFGEITPKFIAKIYPEKIAMAFFVPIKFFYYVLYVFNFIFSGWKWLISKTFRLHSEDVVTEEEIMTVALQAEEDGTIRKDETRLIRSVIEFDDLSVSDILVPRVNIVAVEQNESMENIKKIFEDEGYSRIPVFNESIDQIIGTIHEKDFFKAYLNKSKNVKDIMQEAFYTTEHSKISRLLKQLQKNKVHMAVVLDEYGGTLGIVTLEDILEELVGEIYDEHDEVINYYKKISDTNYLVDGNAPLGDFFEYFSLKGEEENSEASTLSGFIIEMLGEIPRVGTTATYKNLKFEISKATVKRILSVKVSVLPITDAPVV